MTIASTTRQITVTRVRFTRGVRKGITAIQETDAAGALLGIYSDTAEVRARLLDWDDLPDPSGEEPSPWMAVQVLGKYAEGDVDGYWAVVGEGQSVPTTIAEQVLAARLESGWTVAELAREAGLAEEALDQVERGGNASLDVLARLANLLGVELKITPGILRPTGR